MSPTLSIILLAGGQGTRMQSPTPKQFLPLHGKPMALHSFELFCRMHATLIVVCPPAYRSLFPYALFADPGKRRQDSVYNGLQCVPPRTDLVCIHDAARPFLTSEDLHRVIDAAILHKAAALATPVAYTLKQSDSNGFVTHTLDRSSLWEIHTPQIATPSLLQQGFAIANQRKLTVTDDMSLVELTGHPVKLVAGRNLKITTPQDFALAEACLPTN